jgi:hypothetical protein
MKKLLTLPLPLALLPFLLLTIRPDRATSQVVHKPDAVPHRAPDTLRLPLEFEANQGQASAQYPFVAHGPDYALGISPSEIALSLHRSLDTRNAKLVPAAFHPDPLRPESPTQQLQLQLRLAGANPDAAVSGLDRKPGMSNYFIGKDPANWHTSVPHFARVQMAGVYPGVDLIFYGNPEQLEYDFRVAPGADPQVIALQPSDLVSSAIDGDGNLVLSTAAGDVRLKHPEAYQEIDGARRSIPSKFHITAANMITFELGTYDHAHPLIIDPVLTYGVSFGGDDGSQAIGIDIDAAGNAYVAGNTCSTDFPTGTGPFQIFQGNPELSACQEAFVLKLDPTGSTLLYSDFIGGTGVSTAAHIAVDSSGDAFVTGATSSTDFPLVSNIGPASTLSCALVSKGFNCPDAFVFKLNPTGSSLIFSTLMGGSQSSGGFYIRVNPVTGDLMILGNTDSADFLPTPNTLQTTFDGGTCVNGNPCFNAFLVALDPATGAYRYGTFYGGAWYSCATGLAFDAAGDIYLTGSAEPPLSSSVGAATHTYQGSGPSNSSSHIFVARLHPNNKTLSPVYLTVIEGEADDGASGIAIDATGNAYITGSTASADLPTTPGAFQTNDLYPPNVPTSCGWASAIAAIFPQPCGTGFVAKLTPAGALTFLTYLGGNDQTWSEAIALDSTGNIWITGVTSASDFPFTKDAYKPSANNFVDLSPFLAELSNDGSTLAFASPIASIIGQSYDLKIDANNNVYVTGFASAAPSTPGTYPGSVSLSSQYANPLFVQKWSPGPEPVMTVSATSLTFPPTIIGSTSASQTVTIANTGAGTLELGIQTISPNPAVPGTPFLVMNGCGATLAPNAVCTLTVSLQPFTSPPNCTVENGCDPQSQIATIVIQNNSPSGTQQVTLTGTSGNGAVASVTPRAVTFPAQAAGTSSAMDSGIAGATQYVQLSNVGDLNLVLTSATLGGPNAADFQLTNQCPASLPPGFESSCQLSIVFSPAASATGNRTATLTLVDNAADSPQTVSITGPVATATPALYYFPNPVDFGYALIAPLNYVAQLDVDVANVSLTQVQVTGVTFGGPNAADFNLLPNGSNGQLTLNPGAEGEIGIYFNPTSGTDGPRTATATLTTNPVIPGLAPIQLQGVASNSTDPGVSVYTSISPMDFGSVEVGQSSQGASTYLLIGNTGSVGPSCSTAPCGGPLIISSISSGLSDYTVISQQGSPANCATFPVTIPVQGSCGFNVMFAPTQAGARNTTLTIHSNDPGVAQTIPVTGVGLALPLGDLSATVLNFGYAAIGVASPPLTVNLQNTSAGPLTLSSVTSSANYTVSSNTCSTGVAPMASCTIGVTFTPPTAGSFSGTLTISDNDAFGGQQTVALNGIGATGPSLMILPSALSFPNQPNNTTGPPQLLTLTNFGDTAITFGANAFVTASADAVVSTSQFVISSNTCGSSLAVHASCIVNLEFAPTAPASLVLPQTLPGTLTLADNARFSPQRVYLAGTAVQGGVNLTTTTLTSSLNPATSGQSITFTAVVAGTTTNSPPPSGSVTIMDGTTALGTGTLNGSAQATYTTSSLSAGSHSITAVYGSDANYAASTSSVLTQVVNGPATAATTTTLTAAPNPATVGQTVVLTGTVAETSGNAVPTGTVTFYDGTTALGTGTLSSGSATYPVTSLAAGTHSITASYGGDTSNSSSTSSAITVTVTAAAPAATATTLAASTTSAVGGTSIIFMATVMPASGTAVPSGTVTFLDGTTTLGTGTLNGSGIATYSTSALAVGAHSITAAYGGATTFAASTSTAVSVTITAPITPSYTVSISPASGTVAAGSSASATISVTPAGGFSQVVSLACTGAPANATCVVNPTSVTPSGSAAATATLTIQTDVNVASASRRSHPSSPQSEVLLSGIALLGWTLLRRRRRSLWSVQLTLALALLASAVVTGCGSGGASNRTPPGAYTLTVTGTSGTTTQTATYSLTVQ